MRVLGGLDALVFTGAGGGAGAGSALAGVAARTLVIGVTARRSAWRP